MHHRMVGGPTMVTVRADAGPATDPRNSCWCSPSREGAPGPPPSVMESSRNWLRSRWCSMASGDHSSTRVDHISSVSGGSFTAAYFGLFGRRIFEDFEERFLHRDLQSELIGRVLRPWVWIPLLSADRNNSDLAASIYDETIFDGARFVGPPRRRWTAHPDQRDRSRIRESPSRSCRSNSISFARPSMTTPLRRRSPRLLRCPVFYRRSRSTTTVVNATTPSRTGSSANSRVSRASSARISTLGIWHRIPTVVDRRCDSSTERCPTISACVDPFESTTIRGPRSSEEPNPRGPLRHMLFVLVNADTAPASLWEAFEEAPGIARIIQSTSGAQITRYNLETIELLRGAFRAWNDVAARWSEPMHFYLAEVDFMRVADDEERRFLNELPTTLALPEESVARVRRAAREGLRASPEFQRFLRATRGEVE